MLVQCPNFFIRSQSPPNFDLWEKVHTVLFLVSHSKNDEPIPNVKNVTTVVGDKLEDAGMLDRDLCHLLLLSAFSDHGVLLCPCPGRCWSCGATDPFKQDGGTIRSCLG